MGMVVTRRAINESTENTVYLDDGTTRCMRTESSAYISEEVPVDDSDIYNIGIEFNVHKSNSDEGLVSGWANVAVNADGSIPLDWQDDIISPATLEKAAINFMMDYRGSGVMHEGSETGVVVESIVFTKEKQACLGIPEGILAEGWFITVKVLDPEVFEKVKNGTYKMFSIQGNAKRIKL